MTENIGEILLAQVDTIVESWIDSIRNDVDIKSSKGLSYESVRDSIPVVIEAIAALLSQTIANRPQQLHDRSWKHGVLRAEQGYDLAEIVREYSLLRKIIFTVLASDLEKSSGAKVLQVVELIDSAIDRIITLSLESYMAMQLSKLEQIRGQLLLNNQELTRLAARQQENISHLAHELKSPLNSIMGFSSLLLQQQQKAVQGADSSLNLRLTDKVIANSKQLLRLINDVLEISRYDEGKISLNLRSCDVRSLIGNVADTLEISATQKDLTLIYNSDRAPETIYTDPLKLQQIATNLIGNAIRYTDTGTVTVTCSTENDNQWSLVVADTGIGIDSESQAQIFEPYFRVIDKSSDRENSSGLGLAIVDKLVTLLQGQVSFNSQLGSGSTFTVVFPITVSDSN